MGGLLHRLHAGARRLVTAPLQAAGQPSVTPTLRPGWLDTRPQTLNLGRQDRPWTDLGAGRQRRGGER